MAEGNASNRAGFGLQPHHDGLSKTLSRISNYGNRNSDSPLDMNKPLSCVSKVIPSLPNILPSSDNFGDPYELGDAYDPLIKRSVWEIPLEDQKPYLKYVKSISESFPHIRWLADFMEVGTFPYKWKFLSEDDIETRAKLTRVAMVDLFPDKEPTRVDFQKSDKLTQLLRHDSFNHNPEHARIFIVEDLSRDVIEAFGAQYDIDPLFFRAHVSDYLWYNTRDPWAELQDLSHISQERNFFNIRYMIPKYFQSQESIETAISQLGGYNVLRRIEQELSWKVREMRKIRGSLVGVIRSKASLWIRDNKPGESGTLAILVVDPTLKEGSALWGGPRNLQPCPSMHSAIPLPPPINSHFETVIHYTLQLSKNNILSIPSNPHALGVPILSLIAAEWLTVVTYITTTLTKIEYELENAQYRDSSTGLTGALDRLHPLRRLMPVYRNMITETLTTILNPSHPLCSTPCPLLPKLQQDFTAILDAIDSLQTRTQNIISLATTIISIEENQRAMKMNVNLVRVTYLAVIFVPMAFVSSFFSMTPDLAAIESTVWVYFAVAIPLTVLCVAAADPKRVKGMWRSGVGWARGRRGG